MANLDARLRPQTMMSAYYAAAFFVNGIVMPFFPLLLVDRGLGPQDIAFVLAMPFLGRVIAMPVITGYADRSSERRHVVIAVAAVMLVFGLMFGPLTERWSVMLVGSLLLILNFSLGPLADSIAVSMERRGEGDYGRMRLWGSASFIGGSLLGGAVIDHLGVGSIYSTMLIGMSIALAATLLVPSAGPAPAVAPAASLTILRRPAFLAVLAAGAFMQSSHAALYGFATLTWQARGYDETAIGVFWAVGVIAEIILFALASRIPSRIPTFSLLLLCGLIGTGRWIVFAYDFGAFATAALQLLHAGSFAIGHVAVMRFLRETVPEQKNASAQGTYVILVGLAMAAATALSGRLWIAYGDHTFMVMSVFSAIGVAILILSGPGASRLGASGRIAEV